MEKNFQLAKERSENEMASNCNLVGSLVYIYVAGWPIADQSLLANVKNHTTDIFILKFIIFNPFIMSRA